MKELEDLRQAISAAQKVLETAVFVDSLQTLVKQLEKDAKVMKQKLAIYEEFVQATYACGTRSWAREHGCMEGHSNLAKKCKELIAAVDRTNVCGS